MAPVWRVRALVAGQLNASELAGSRRRGTEAAFNKSPRRMSLWWRGYNRNDQLHVIVEAAPPISGKARTEAMNSLVPGNLVGTFSMGNSCGGAGNALLWSVSWKRCNSTAGDSARKFYLLRISRAERIRARLFGK